MSRKHLFAWLAAATVIVALAMNELERQKISLAEEAYGGRCQREIRAFPGFLLTGRARGVTLRVV
ncbi:MAG TPA: hypothetical protein VJN18_02085 [Polyangiaceae bacterium]|nr:hypothetical protein [Polyangiaceae bacterium]